LAVAAAMLVAALVWPPDGSAQKSSERPIVVVETSKGSFSFEMFPDDAPWTVRHVADLVEARFYDGLRVHRAIPGFVIQFGDPQTRDPGQRDRWGRGPQAASGKPVDAAEISPKRRHGRGAVGMAHLGNPAKADSQIYITLEPRPDLDGRYAVFGQVVSGMDVLPLLRVGDEVRRVYRRQ
jgi:peptidyl-prolyl cis-trans isomerase B (cyclophilin B)